MYIYYLIKTYKLPNEQKYYHDVHFWLGLDTTQDEAGTAAYKTVELDDFLLGDPVQHREVQGHESKLFMSYFKYFVSPEGGVESGFKKVGPKEYVPRLFQVSGNMGATLVVRQVPRTCASLNEGDVFILDVGHTIYQWNGISASGKEKHKSMEFCSALASERKGAKVVVFGIISIKI
jgi:gelsolin